MGTTSFSDMPPEVQAMIGRYFWQNELPVCLRVCQAWKTLFSPYLWREADLSWNRKEVEFDFVNGLKTYGQHLRSLTLRDDSVFLCSVMRSRPSFQLTSLEMHLTHVGHWIPFVNFLTRGSTTGWRRLVISVSVVNEPSYEFGPDFFAAVLKHASTLEVLRLEDECYADAESVNRLLCSAPNLKVLHISNDHKARYNGGYLDAKAIVDAEWVCSNLEVFACEIRNIPRPDITREIRGQPATEHTQAGTLEESIELQRRIFSKLSQFTKLRELTLGFHYNAGYPKVVPSDWDDIRQYDCLAMTLDSGLDMLKDLKEIQEVGLPNMEIYIDGEQEQSWFDEHWPNVAIDFETQEADQSENNTFEELTSDDDTNIEDVPLPIPMNI
ncbi:hypothetical protein BGZ96_003451 [Linnemannia gamsii]|uniref:F-box domain-containing protein n=1 Tax=Linnemannia gamsii TaxID=64522 RepID=A0ABQ7K8R1_9FUNG|nr:hypothetical protein BGZ96_003451 [Linnemannia gamsii]